MGKSRDLADLIASGSILADGTLSTTEIDGVTATSGELNLLDAITRGSILYGAAGDSSARLSIGSSGTVLTSNGTDISWTTPAPSGLQNVSEDTTPQLGGNLDLNGNDLVTTSNADIDLDPNGTGTVVFKGNSTKGSGQFKLNCEVNSHGITIQGPPHSAAANYTLTLPNDDGTADQVLSTNGSGTLSWADAGGTPLVQSFTANGAIASGKPVILETAGTVAEVSETTIAPDAPIGSRTLVDGNNTEYLSVAADPHNSNRWAAVYMDDIGNKDLFIKIFTRSGTTITQSSAISLVTGGTANRTCSVAFDKGQANVMLLMYNNNVNTGVVRTATISGSAGSESISLGGETSFHTASPIYTATQKGCRALICLDTSGNYMGIWHNASTTIDARIFQVSGTSVTAGGSDVTVASNFYSGSEEMDIVGHYSDTSKVYFGYRNSSQYLETKLLTVSGTSISVGTGYANSNTLYNAGLSLNPISNTKIIATYSENTNDYPSYQVITDDGSGTFSYGTSTVLDSNSTLTTISRNSSTNPLTIPYYYSSNRGSGDKPFVRILTSNSDASTITVSSEDQIDTNTIASTFNGMDVQADDSAHYLMLGEYSSDLYFILGKAGGSSTNLTSTNYIGIAEAAISDTASGNIMLRGGVSEKVSSLTPGSVYYIQSDGTFATSAGSPSVEAGKALSATKLLLKGV